MMDVSITIEYVYFKKYFILTWYHPFCDLLIGSIFPLRAIQTVSNILDLYTGKGKFI